MWVDLDVYCLRPSTTKKILFGINYKKGTVNNCVLKIPRYSVALHLVRNFLRRGFQFHSGGKQRLDLFWIRFRGRFANAEFTALDNN